MLTVSVADEVFDRVPDLRLILFVARGISLNATSAQAIDEFWNAAWTRVHEDGVRPADHPNIQSYRRALKAAGIKIQDFPPAVEAIYRRACKSPTAFSVSSIVNFYNACSLTESMPIAGFDIGFLGDNLLLGTFTGEEAFHGIGRDGAETVSPGEIGYLSSDRPLSRQFMWRQSRDAALGEGTTDLLLITEAVEGIDADNVARMSSVVSEGISRWFGVKPIMVTIDSGHKSVTV
ncbi:B3/B4 domain-containing protein [Pseudomonas azerbaijanoccidentalis]|jgi:DNA/RNA-binding domain of Phe-tRNA-synthetase-like protein